MRFSSPNLFLSRLRDHLYWILRRSNAGFLTGFIAWFFIPYLSQIFSQNASFLLSIIPGSLPTSMTLLFFITHGLLGGAFLGTVDGMIEESTPKTIQGALLGGIGGVLGGLIFGLIQDGFSNESLAWGFFIFWAIPGVFIGLVSALWERKPKKLMAGALGGLIGGGVGGGLASVLHSPLIEKINPESFMAIHFLEGINGGIIGVALWFAIATAERFVIFDRRPVNDKNSKLCDHCDAKNELSMWYCGSCGSVLQEAAKPEQLKLNPFQTLDRIKGMFEFLSRLTATTGILGGAIVFFVLMPVNAFLSFVVLVLVGVTSYSLMILFSALAESIQIFSKDKSFL